MGGACPNFCKEFTTFAVRGNVVDLAVGIITGTAFTDVVKSLVDDIITPPFGLIVSGVDLVYKNRLPVVIRYGKFIQTIIPILIMVFALVFVIKGINKLHEIIIKKKQKKENKEMIQIEINEQVKILCEIRDLFSKTIFSYTLDQIKFEFFWFYV